MIDLPYPNINGETDEKKLAQINNYLIQLKDALEFTLMSMSDENRVMSQSLEKGLSSIDAEIEDNLSQVNSLKIGAGDVSISLNDSDDELRLVGNRVIIESDNFKLSKNGNIEMLSGKIKIIGTVTKYAKDYSQSDIDRVNAIILGNVVPTIADYEKLDLNGDGLIDVMDMISINKFLNGSATSREIPTYIELNPLQTQSLLKTDGISIGTKGAYFENLNSNTAYMKDVYVMAANSGFQKGYSGTFTSANGKTVTVTNGIITSIA